MKTSADPIFTLIQQEKKRQKETLALIPSENYASPEVMRAVGSVLMNKYAEGQAKKRYYQGNSIIDEVELLCKSRALQVFGLREDEWGVNVQTLSGSPANLAVYVALLEPGDKIFAMYLPDGGHLSHGWQLPGNKVTLVSKIWDIEFYHVNKETRVFDYDQIEQQALKFRPKLIVSGGTAYPREIDHKRIGAIAKKVGAYYLADVAHEAGLIAGGANASPFPHADVVSMTTHKTLRGPRGAMVFSRKPIDEAIDKAVFPGLQGGPHEHTIGGIAVALGEALQPSFKDYTRQVVINAQLLAAKLKSAGYDVVSGGTDKHLVLVDLRSVGLSGWVAAWALEYAGIIANRNTVPYETASPFFPSGLRLGTPAVTTRGMKEKEIQMIADWIIKILTYAKKWQLPKDKELRKEFTRSFRKEIVTDRFLKGVQKEVVALCKKFPIYRKS